MSYLGKRIIRVEYKIEDVKNESVSSDIVGTINGIRYFQGTDEINDTVETKIKYGLFTN